MSGGHTKGPWRVSSVDPHLVVVGDGPSKGLNIAHAQTFVLEYRDQSLANARLIAGAPDLLAALTEILGPLNICSDNRHVRDDECLPIDITMGELRKARAAIARATGGQS